MRAIVIHACLFLSLSACACEKVQASGHEENVQEGTMMNENDRKVLWD